MTLTKTLTLWCEGVNPNGHRCNYWTVGDGVANRAADLRRIARREGWIRRDGKDYCCPEHAPDAT